jgi:hypothetical protein
VTVKKNDTVNMPSAVKELWLLVDCLASAVLCKLRPVRRSTFVSFSS